MTLHAAIEYLKYKWLAKSRHGIHSPYVYEFIELVLQDRGKIAIDKPVHFEALSPAYNTLIDRMAKQYNYKAIQCLPGEVSTEAVSKCDMILFPGKEPLLWASLSKEYFPLLKHDTVVLIPDVHKTAMHTYEWNRVRSNGQVMMSIDLYGMGVLVFRAEFKVKQHFVLKYEA